MSNDDSPEGIKIVPFELPESESLGTLYRVWFWIDSSLPLPQERDRPAALLIWLYALSPESAFAKARNIVQELPYTITSAECIVNPCPVEVEEPLEDEHERTARACGLSLMLCTVLNWNETRGPAA